MASGSPAPSAPAVRPRPVPTARPGGLLTAAAAVPLGVAVLYASGWLAWGPRLALGIAVVVLGNALRDTVGSVTGARITAPVARTVGLAFMAGGLLIVIGAALTALGLDRAPAADEAGNGGAFGGTLGLFAVPVVALVVASTFAIGLRAPSAVRTAQEVGTACALVAGLGVLVLANRVAESSVLGTGDAVLDGIAALGAVLLLALLVFGTALLAVSAARRSSRGAVAGVVVGAVAAALWTATVSVATATEIDVTPTDHGVGALLLRPLDLLLGFGDPARLLQDAEPGWPVLFGVVGGVLAATAAWLESRRPVPADAPVASRDDA